MLLYPLLQMGFFHCLGKNQKALYKMDDFLDAFIQKLEFFDKLDGFLF